MQAGNVRYRTLNDIPENVPIFPLSGALLLGLGANALAGWWWADPITALVIAAVAVREGREAWRGEACCEVC